MFRASQSRSARRPQNRCDCQANPTSQARFFAPATINLEATASSDDGIGQVEFFAGLKSLGKVTTIPYQLVASNLVVGTMP